MDDDLFIVHSDSKIDNEIEIQFADILCFQNDVIPDAYIKSFVLRLNEKCDLGCSYKNIEKCINDEKMYCLPKIFYGILSGFRPQPHKGGEFGDISGQIQVADKHYQMIGIIKKIVKIRKDLIAN